MIILDTNSLVRWIVVDEVEDDAARFMGLIKLAKESGQPIAIPTPVLAEFLVRSEDATADLLATFERRRAFRILPFDKKSAHECAILEQAAHQIGKKRGNSNDAWQKVKIDRQIIAIARSNNAQLIVSNDVGASRTR